MEVKYMCEENTTRLIKKIVEATTLMSRELDNVKDGTAEIFEEMIACLKLSFAHRQKLEEMLQNIVERVERLERERAK
jgi:hypothetical protein